MNRVSPWCPLNGMHTVQASTLRTGRHEGWGRVWDTDRRGQFRDMPVWGASPVTVGRDSAGGERDHSASNSLYDLG